MATRIVYLGRRTTAPAVVPPPPDLAVRFDEITDLTEPAPGHVVAVLHVDEQEGVRYPSLLRFLAFEAGALDPAIDSDAERILSLPAVAGDSAAVPGPGDYSLSLSLAPATEYDLAILADY